MEPRPWAFTPWQKVTALVSLGVLLFGGTLAAFNAGRSLTRVDAAAEPAALDPEPAFLRVHVAGAVKRPGVYTFTPRARVIDAVEQAGGAAAGARLDELNLAAPLRDGIRLYIPGPRDGPADEVLVVTEEVYLAPQPAPLPADGEPAASEPRETYLGAVGEATRRPSRPAAPSAPAVVHLNSASLAELQTLPGIGEVLARRILAYRETNGPFRTASDVRNVRGIGEKTYERLKPYLTVD